MREALLTLMDTDTHKKQSCSLTLNPLTCWICDSVVVEGGDTRAVVAVQLRMRSSFSGVGVGVVAGGSARIRASSGVLLVLVSLGLGAGITSMRGALKRGRCWACGV